MVSIFFIILTMIVETGLFIIKQNRDDQKRRKKGGFGEVGRERQPRRFMANPSEKQKK